MPQRPSETVAANRQRQTAVLGTGLRLKTVFRYQRHHDVMAYVVMAYIGLYSYGM